MTKKTPTNTLTQSQHQTSIVPAELVEERIIVLRGIKVMIDADLADIYGVTTKALNQAVKRNIKRFPEQDFMFQLTEQEAEAMRSQSVTASKRNVRYQPFAFTEHGAVMLSAILNSPIAVEASIQVVRAFVKFRSILAAHKELAQKLDELEAKTDTQAKKYDTQFKTILDLIRKIIKAQASPSLPPTPPQPKRPIGFTTDDDKHKP